MSRMVESDIRPKEQILKIDFTISRIISNIKVQVSIILDGQMEENDGGYTAAMLAKESWHDYVYIPRTKGEAIAIIDSPDRSKLDKLGALLYAELYKKRQLREAYEIKAKEESVTGYPSFDVE